MRKAFNQKPSNLEKTGGEVDGMNQPLAPASEETLRPFDPVIPRQVASPQSLSPLYQAT